MMFCQTAVAWSMKGAKMLCCNKARFYERVNHIVPCLFATLSINVVFVLLTKVVIEP